MVAGGGDEEEKRGRLVVGGEEITGEDALLGWFNGSGGLKNDKDLRAGVALCARATFLGHADAIRELGHCLQDGYGVRKNVEEGHRLLVQANAHKFFVHGSRTEASHALEVSGGEDPLVCVVQALDRMQYH
ncbi:Tetratricopeptide-like helical, partial [Cynara cardunculus var. scolymus]